MQRPFIPLHKRAKSKIILVFDFGGDSLWTCSEFALTVISNGIRKTVIHALPAAWIRRMKARAPDPVRGIQVGLSERGRILATCRAFTRPSACLPLFSCFTSCSEAIEPAQLSLHESESDFDPVPASGRKGFSKASLKL